mmetsp:Transcript_40330/g.90609  ORF Transcript_40330/g.90609 Transcript_40330/m.90609 type:complete len:551 (-) Transcript_40330:244-1896(-)
MRVLCSLGCGAAVGQSVIPPPDTSKAAVVLAFQGRPDAASGAYDALISEVQSEGVKAGVSVWAVTGPSFDDMKSAIQSTVSAHQAKLFYAGHGMGGAGEAAAQAAAGDSTAEGAILVAGFLPRDYRPDLQACKAKWGTQPTHKCPKGKGLPLCPGGYLPEGSHDCSATGIPAPKFPVPTLSVGGELDGVVRVSRVAEAWYTQKGTPEHKVVVVEGMNHGDLLGTVPSSVQARDLVSEIGGDKAKAQVASIVAGFLADPKSYNPPAADDTLSPFEKMFVEQEGSWWWTPNSEESGSSPWAAAAQEKMCEPLSDTKLQWETSNEFHLLSDEDGIPPYYRAKHRPNVTMQGGKVAGSTVAQLRYTTLTVTQVAAGENGYELIKEEKAGILGTNAITDDGSDYVSAIEIATKLSSRQLCYNRTNAPEDPESLDDGDHCAAINQAAYDMAMSTASSAARARFQKSGRPMKMVSDRKPTPPAGPWWVWNYLQYNDKGTDGMEISSWYAFYSLTAPSFAAGNHYCKLLSPARALEWIYTDGLRAASLVGPNVDDIVV